MRAIWLVPALLIPLAASSAPRSIVMRSSVATAPTPVSVDLPAPPNGRVYRLVLNGKTVPSQSERMPAGTRLTWIAPPSSQGEVRDYRVDLVKEGAGTPPALVVLASERGWEFRAGGDVAAQYDVKTGPNKPYFWPVNAPGGINLMRNGPVKPVPGETTDHPHHRGLWFTHGAVNGVDYWSEGSKTGRTVCTGAKALVSGPVYSSATFSSEWIDPAGRKVATDSRLVTLYAVPGAYVMDLRVTLTAREDLLFGDTKEGSMGIRVPDALRPAGGNGHIVNAEGLADGATWGKRSLWVDYCGPVEGKTVGIAMMDTSDSFRHPTYWHVRDYGLFAANPFGVHDFVKGEAAAAGDYHLPAGKSLVFSYRIILHSGDTTAADIAGYYRGLATPPTVTVGR